jgi:hypothetical protein
MKQTLTTHDIIIALRGDENAHWSFCGAVALAEHLEDLERDLGEETEFDACAIRCNFSEYRDPIEWAVDYFGGKKEAMDKLGLESLDIGEDLDVQACRDYIQDRGTLIEFDGGIIVSSF